MQYGYDGCGGYGYGGGGCGYGGGYGYGGGACGWGGGSFALIVVLLLMSN